MTELDKMILIQDQENKKTIRARKELEAKLGLYIPHRLYLDKVKELKNITSKQNNIQINGVNKCVRTFKKTKPRKEVEEPYVSNWILENDIDIKTVIHNQYTREVFERFKTDMRDVMGFNTYTITKFTRRLKKHLDYKLKIMPTRNGKRYKLL